MALSDKNENKFTSFDDVDLFEAENCSTLDDSLDVNNATAKENDEFFVPKDDVVEPATYSSADSNSDIDFVNKLQTDHLEEKTDVVEAESCTFSTEVDGCCDNIDGSGDHSVITATHSSSLSPEVVYSDAHTFPSACASSESVDLETSTAVLTLDSDVDSPQRQKTYCDLDSGDGMEVNVAALQLQLTQLTKERDKLNLLYSQSKEENENYQEQILEVWPSLCIAWLVYLRTKGN